MLVRIDTRNPAAVEHEVRSIYASLFPEREPAFVARVFQWATQCFGGGFRDFLPVDIGYHDFEHTLQGTLCLARLLQGYSRAHAQPLLTVRAFELGIVAILFHDTGYLKRRDDTEGTGAKYTAIHVERSTVVAGEFLGAKGYADEDIQAVQNMIGCTSVIDADLKAIRFQNELERTVGYALGTADLLGQMAAADYVEKLPALFTEFAEGVRYAAASAVHLYAFESADAMTRDTPAYWMNYVRPKLDRDFRGLYSYLNDPYPGGPNQYLQWIEANVARVRQRLAST